MDNKDKIIEEMAKEICSQTMTEYCASGRCSNQFYCQVNYNALETLYNAGYRKIDKDSVVLSMEELNKKYVSVEMYELAKAFHNEKCAEFEKLCYDYHKLQHKIDDNNEKIASEIADIIAKERKETAEKILNELYVQFSSPYLVGLRNEYYNTNIADLIKRYAKCEGVEIKE